MVLLLLINILNFQKSDYYTLIIVCTDYLQKLPEVVSIIVSIKRKTSLQSLVMRFLSDSVGIRQNRALSGGIGYFTGPNNVV